MKDRILHQMLAIIVAGIALLLVWLVGSAYARWLGESEVFSLRRIEVTGNELMPEEKILKAGNLMEGVSTWDVNLKQVEQAIDQNPFFDAVTINRRLPNELVITIEEKRPVALLKVNKIFLCIDPEGLVLPSTPGKLYDLPVLSGDFKGEIGVGHYAGGPLVQEGLHFLLSVLKYRPKLYPAISEVMVGKSKGMTVYTTSSGIPVWIGEEKILNKINCLDAILVELSGKKELSQVRYIDLRFEGQVVVGMRI